MPAQPIATLLTDFGTIDPYVASVKGVLLSICPQARIVDISHDVPAHDVLAAAFVLGQSAPFFPRGTVHVVVVDPGVGTSRHILAARYGGQDFLFPDNGVITMVDRVLPLEAMVIVSDMKHLTPALPSMTFEGRDVFAPVAGHLLNGADLRKLGRQPETYKTLELPAPKLANGQMTGQVIYIDRFGNLISNISEDQLIRRWSDPKRVHVSLAGEDIGNLTNSYGFVETHKPLALLNSMSLVEVAVNQGRACDELAVGVGAEVVLTADDR